MHINVSCTFMPFCNICNLNLSDELEDNGFKLFLDITNYHYKGNIFLNTNFINPSYNDITPCISLCVTRKQHITLGDRRWKFSAFYTSKLHIYQMPKFIYWFPSHDIFYTLMC